MSEANRPADPWEDVLQFVVCIDPSLIRDEEETRKSDFAKGLPPRELPIVILDEDEARRTLDRLAEWWAEQRAFKTRNGKLEMESFQKAVESLLSAWDNLHESSRTQFLKALGEEQFEIREYLNKIPTQEWWKVSLVQKCLLPTGIFKMLKNSADAAVARYTNIPMKTIARFALWHPEEAGNPGTVGVDHPDFQVCFHLARWYFEATGEIPSTKTPKDHHKNSDPEFPQGAFERLVRAVQNEAFKGDGQKFSSLRTEAIRPAVKRFRELAPPTEGENSLRKEPGMAHVHEELEDGGKPNSVD